MPEYLATARNADGQKVTEHLDAGSADEAVQVLRYRGLIDAVAWGRWEEVLARADSVGGQVAPEEIAFQKAKALAGLGRPDEALRLVEPFGEGRRIPPWRYWSRLAEVYATARRYE